MSAINANNIVKGYFLYFYMRPLILETLAFVILFALIVDDLRICGMIL